MHYQGAKFKADVDGTVLKDVLISQVGPLCGHFHEGNQVLADMQTLKVWEGILNSKPVMFRKNHTENDVMGTFGKFVIGSAKIIGEQLLASVELLPVAFTRATGWIGEYVQSMAASAPEFVNLSIESDCEVEPVKAGVVIRPVDLPAVALVTSGASTDSLFAGHRAYNASKGRLTLDIDGDTLKALQRLAATATAINNITTLKGSIMAEEVKKEEEVKPEVITEEVKSEVKAEEVPKTEEVKDEAKKDEEVKEEIKEEVKVEDVKAEEVAPAWATALSTQMAEILALLKPVEVDASKVAVAASKKVTVNVLADDVGMPSNKVEKTKSEAELIRDARRAYKSRRN